MCRVMKVLVLACLFYAGGAVAATLPWNIEALQSAPAVYAADGFSAKGMRALFFEGLPYKGKSTRVFAWYGAPAVPPGGKLPAMVLVHGGGGTAFEDWVRLWMKRGYAAIAMDTCGCVPKGKYGDWQRHEHGGPAGWGGFDKVDDAVVDQWPYHAVADVILAHSLIRSFPEVDADRTGITGISWGGYLTCIVAGVDHRFKCAIPVYGCGFLGEDSAWLDQFQQMGREKAARWLDLWDPSVYLSRAPMPMLWVTGTNDFAYPMDSLQRSYRLVADHQLCVRIRMPHGHMGPGENPEEIHVFADSRLKNGPALPRITSQGREGGAVFVKYKSELPVAKAELVYTKDSGKWQERNWLSAEATVDAAHEATEATLPEGTTVYYINLITPDGLVISSEHEEIK